MIRRPPRSTLDRSSAASDVYKRQDVGGSAVFDVVRVGDDDEHPLELLGDGLQRGRGGGFAHARSISADQASRPAKDPLSLIHISEPTRPY